MLLVIWYLLKRIYGTQGINTTVRPGPYSKVYPAHISITIRITTNTTTATTATVAGTADRFAIASSQPATPSGTIAGSAAHTIAQHYAAAAKVEFNRI